MSERCETCAFLLRIVHQSGLEPWVVRQCRRYPPVHVVDFQRNHTTDSYYTNHADIFPTVTADDWCGEYRAPSTPDQESERS